MRRTREDEYTSHHRGTFQEIIANAKRGTLSETSNPDGSTETVVGPMPSEELEGSTVGEKFSGTTFKFWTSQHPNIEGVALTWDGNVNLTLLETDRVFDSIDAAKAWINSQLED